MANWRILEKSLFPLAVILKLVPFIAIAPLLRIWLGYELQPKILLAALITFFPVLVNCIAGFRSAEPRPTANSPRGSASPGPPAPSGTRSDPTRSRS